MAEQNASQTTLEQGGRGEFLLRVRIHYLLVEGHPVRRVSELCSCSLTYVRKIARILVGNGELQPVGKYGRTFQVPLSKETTPPVPTPQRNNPPPKSPYSSMIPKSVGAVFSIQKKPLGLQFNLGKMAYHNDMPLFKSQWGPHKCQIWLHGGFHGKDPQEIRANARQAILQIAGRLEDKYHTELTAIRWHREEWVDFDIPRSAKIADAAGIPKGGRIEVEGAIHKFSDWSDPDKVQFNPKPQGNGEIPLAHAQIHHKLYSGLYEDKLRELEERQVRALSLMEKLVDGTEKNTEALTAIQQRMNGGLR